MPWPTAVMAPLVTIHTFSQECLGLPLAACAAEMAGAAGAAYPAANRGLYLPFTCTKNIVVVSLFCYNGATVGNGTVDMGIYDRNRRLLVSIGATTTTGASVLQSLDITDTEIGAGHYYLGIVLTSATDTLFRVSAPTARHLTGWGMAQQGIGSGTLPAAATFAAVAANYVPLIGLTTRGVL